MGRVDDGLAGGSRNLSAAFYHSPLAVHSNEVDEAKPGVTSSGQKNSNNYIIF